MLDKGIHSKVVVCRVRVRIVRIHESSNFWKQAHFSIQINLNQLTQLNAQCSLLIYFHNFFCCKKKQYCKSEYSFDAERIVVSIEQLIPSSVFRQHWLRTDHWTIGLVFNISTKYTIVSIGNPPNIWSSSFVCTNTWRLKKSVWISLQLYHTK